ncbi:MAG: hypothetical protein ABII80_00475 [bacterium]
MKMTTIYAWSKKIHRWSMWFAIGLGVPLSLTGIIMEESDGWGQTLGIQFLLWSRSIHRAISTKFVLVLGIMIVSGLVMWAIPELIKLRARKKNQKDN